MVGQVLFHLTRTAGVALGADPQVLACRMGKGGMRRRSGPLRRTAQDGAPLRVGALCEGRDGDGVGQVWAPVVLISRVPEKIQVWGMTGVLELSEG